MNEYVEVVRVVDGRLFDAECYECAESVLDRAPGYYAVIWSAGTTLRRFDVGATFLGPFATAQQAESVKERHHV